QVSELLNENQLLGLFSRLEKKRLSGVSIARKTRVPQLSKSSRKRKIQEVVHSGDEKDEVDQNTDPTEEEIEDEIDEETYVKQCIASRHKEIFV
ncbi:hypothetical protein PFISCL1PPCAC_7414, partial [Pristionchus fissidentatus]